MTQLRTSDDLDRLAELVADGRLDSYSAAERLFAVPVEP
jgi:LAO/AO transport system kinase